MPNFNLSYRTDRLMPNWEKPSISYFVEVVEDEELDDIEEEVIESEEDIEEYGDIATELIDDLGKIKKRAKRQLELYIRTNKDKINILGESNKERVLDFVRRRFFDK